MISRHILQHWFTLSSFPTFICPKCGIGTLNHREKPHEIEPPFSANSHTHYAWEPDWIELRLAGILQCAKSSCGQVVAYSADGGLDWDVNENGEQFYQHYFQFKSINPAPSIIVLPEDLPKAIKKPLNAAFEVYWVNKELAANACRQAIEALLDHHAVPRISAKDKRLPLAGRIDIMSGSKPEYAELFSLFRPLLNAGSHGEEIEVPILLSVFEALEIHLSQVFDTKPDRLEELKALLKKSSGSS